MTKAETALQAQLQAMIDARDAGSDYFKTEPDHPLVAVARHAATLKPDDKNFQIGFIQGYSTARQSHDAYKAGE